MEKEKIIQIIQEDIHKYSEELDEQNYSSSIEKLELVLKYARLALGSDFASNELPEIEPLNILDEIEEEVALEEEPQPAVFYEEPTLENTTFQFARAISGGYIRDNNKVLKGDVYVSESILRSLGLENGHIVALKEKPINPDYPAAFPYLISIEGKNEDVLNTITEFDYGIVELDYDTNKYFVKRNIHNQPIGYSEDDRYEISEKEVTKLDIMSDDIVEIAYRTNDFSSAKIRWKYNTSEVSYEPNVEQKIMSSTVKKEPINPPQEKEIKFDLEGKKILLVGMGVRASEFTDFIKENNGTIIVHDKKSGNKWRKNLEAAIKRVDVVIIGQLQVSHSQSQGAISLAKKHNKPHATFTSYGKEAFMQSIIKALEK